MAGNRKLGQRTWRFSDAGNKFDGRQRPVRRSDVKPISPALKRGVIRCKRCGSRVVSNVDNCPFCGKSLRPFFMRLWFWLIVVVVVAIAVFALVRFSLPEENTTTPSPQAPELPTVIGAGSGTTLKDLSFGTGIDNSGLEVTVGSVTEGPLALNGAQILIVEVEFVNKRSAVATLYSTQWQLETAQGERLDTFIGSAADGTTLLSNFDAYELAPGGRFAGRLLFAVNPVATEAAQAAEGAGANNGTTEAAPVNTPEDVQQAGSSAAIQQVRAVIYQPSALAYHEDLLVTWKLP